MPLNKKKKETEFPKSLQTCIACVNVVITGWLCSGKLCKWYYPSLGGKKWQHYLFPLKYCINHLEHPSSFCCLKATTSQSELAHAFAFLAFCLVLGDVMWGLIWSSFSENRCPYWVVFEPVLEVHTSNENLRNCSHVSTKFHGKIQVCLLIPFFVDTLIF